VTEALRGGRPINHFQFCAWKVQKITLLTPGSLFPDGIDYRLTMMARASENSRTIEVTFSADKIRLKKRRSIPPEFVNLVMTAGCPVTKGGGLCNVTPSNRQTMNLRQLELTGMTFIFQSPQTPTATNPISKVFGNLDFGYHYVSAAGGQQLLGKNLGFGMGWRCDSAQLTRKEFKNPACVFPTLAHLRFNINDAGITESAAHIREAQNDPNSTSPKPPQNQPKSIPLKITRHWDVGLKDRQRTASRAACVAAFPTKPVDTDCDEYPFASTREGSLFGAPTPNYNYSVKYIKSADNRLSGCWMGRWLVVDRVLEDDEYEVNVFDGPVFPEPAPEPVCEEEEQ
jgi:hypothetical protein